MRILIDTLCTTLARQEPCVLATVGSQSGSTPRVAGARMLVRADGTICGTIGGGIVESEAISEAKTCFASKQGMQRHFDLSNADASVTDMICGGAMELYMEYIEASAENLHFFRQLQEALQGGRRVVVVSNPGGTIPRFFVDQRGQCSKPDLDAELNQLLSQTATALTGATLLDFRGTRFFLSSFAVGGTLVLVGAGHVAACTAEAAARVGFQVTVLDDRAEFANLERFPLASEVRVLPDFTHCLDGLALDQDSYIVIVTRGHMHDQEVLEQALRTQAGYIGMIGSRRKRNAIYTQLLDRGFKEAQLEQVRCPIGMAIEADTPEEIAISIVGELIYQRATGRRAWHLA
ncbi:MAG: XdhC family protein [Desulfobulbaceae bacterium]|nr:XdhC family protein [Desulfobulbaceae bacterium]